jgi:hypothetical protein
VLDAPSIGVAMALAAVNDPRSEEDERMRRRERLLHHLAMERQRRTRRPSRTA